MEAKTESSLNSGGYFQVIDISNRRERLRELAYTQSGMTEQQLAVGRESAVDFLLFVRLTNQPRSECKEEEAINTTHGMGALVGGLLGNDATAPAQETGLALAWRKMLLTLSGTKPAGVRYLTLFVQGRLTDVQTGDSFSYATSAPYRLVGIPGNPECPSALAALDGAATAAGLALSERLSPQLADRSVPLLDRVDDIEDSEEANSVLSSLQLGIRFARQGDMTEAARQWELALRHSNGRSRAALWNSAIAAWRRGDSATAADRFQKFFDQGDGDDWISDEMLRLWADFKDTAHAAEE
ncbi:MAG: hypothetical protein K1X75_01065 [Leptospirales bacterium]|nr:hypothetical protein [Leptospirales bacterium]